MPRPGSRVIPKAWSTYHQPVAEGTMADSTVRLQRPSSEATFDEAAGRSTYPTPTRLWDGGARIQRISRRGGAEDVGDRPVTEQIYQVSIPVATPEVQINDQILVIAARNDRTLPGKLLRVTEVRLGSELWQRDLLCEETTPTTR